MPAISSPVCSHHCYCSLSHSFLHPAPFTHSFQIFFRFQSTEKLFTSSSSLHKLHITASTGGPGLINDLFPSKEMFFKNNQMEVVQRCRCRLKWPLHSQKMNGPPVSAHICCSVILDVRMCSVFFSLFFSSTTHNSLSPGPIQEPLGWQACLALHIFCINETINCCFHFLPTAIYVIHSELDASK